jgi:HSP20 family protein
MTMIRYQPWGLPSNVMNQLHRELNRMFDAPAGNFDGNDAVATDWVPSVDVKEEADRWVVHADVPGVDPADIEVSMADGALTIRGSRRSESTDEKDGWRRVERVSGSFYRRFTLPDTADAAGIKAASKHGVLELTIPKQPKVQPKRITVNG